MTTIEIVLLSFAIGYGLLYGLVNTIARLFCIITRESTGQHMAGTLLDIVWITIVIYLIISHFTA